ncbi:MAG: amylo-alpha-1,6-glucosidase, partial [Gemmatimonadaceae bacterium]
ARNDLVERRESHFQSLRERTVQFQSPDASLDSAVAWAVHRLDMFMAVPPTGGLALMAGFAKSRAGWSISRPGYAWFFGRDACWSADAMLLAGMFQEVRAIIHHLAGTRDVTGKIYHELTTSGACHYDAADATPLFLRLVGRYYAFTGDRDTLHDVWDAVRQSIAFVMSTDRDHDGLPENSDVGHGWVETGPLGGGVVTSYMAALWIDALGELLELARAMEDDGLVLGLARAREQAVASIDGQLRDRASGRLGLQRNRDGSLATDLTALSAVPIALGVDTHPDSNAILDALTSSAFTTSWGVRMLANTDARYNPTGYHFGAVWPLFTGWTALACFERGRTSEGLALWRANASLATARAKGAFDEVLHGDTGEAAGVCPDQAWSAAMVVAPALAGIWGIRPSRGGRRLLLRLQIPHAWPHAALTGLKVGTAVLDIRVEQREVADGRQLMVAVHQRSGSLEAIGVELFAAPHQRVWTRSGETLRVSDVLPGKSGRWCRWDIDAPSTREILHFVIGADS